MVSLESATREFSSPPFPLTELKVEWRRFDLSRLGSSRRKERETNNNNNNNGINNNMAAMVVASLEELQEGLTNGRETDL